MRRDDSPRAPAFPRHSDRCFVARARARKRWHDDPSRRASVAFGACELFASAAEPARRNVSDARAVSGARPVAAEHVHLGGTGAAGMSGWLGTTSRCRARAHALGSPRALALRAAPDAPAADARLPRCADAAAALRCDDGAWSVLRAAAGDGAASPASDAAAERLLRATEALLLEDGARAAAANRSAAGAAPRVAWRCGGCALDARAASAARARARLRAMNVSTLVFWGDSVVGLQFEAACRFFGVPAAEYEGRGFARAPGIGGPVLHREPMQWGRGRASWVLAHWNAWRLGRR